jgi:hypothetical protein
MGGSPVRSCLHAAAFMLGMVPGALKGPKGATLPAVGGPGCARRSRGAMPIWQQPRRGPASRLVPATGASGRGERSTATRRGSAGPLYRPKGSSCQPGVTAATGSTEGGGGSGLEGADRAARLRLPPGGAAPRGRQLMPREIIAVPAFGGTAAHRPPARSGTSFCLGRRSAGGPPFVVPGKPGGRPHMPGSLRRGAGWVTRCPAGGVSSGPRAGGGS